MRWSKSQYFLAISALMILLVGCSQNTAEDVFNHLEKAVELEQPFEEQQAVLVEAEEKEHQIYEEAIALGLDEFEQIIVLSDEALSSIDQREEAVSLEKESIESSYEEFKQVELLQEEFDDEELLSLFNGFSNEMESRYESYQQLFENYTHSIQLDRELFQLLKEEDLELIDLQTKIDEVNDSYQKVNELKEQFNDFTTQYNQSKQAFYEAANLDVTYVDSND
ncbi:hypothetical protein BTS2_0802 [Bacillus sp. TS-2]|nr:hypothetical protein BTS2_0802 [Bacillus sp. TS-2]